MMIISINEKYRISSDKRQWIIQTPCKITPKTPSGWRNEQFYVNLSSLVTALSERMLRESNVETLSDALDEVKRIQQELTEALSTNYEVTVK